MHWHFLRVPCCLGADSHSLRAGLGLQPRVAMISHEASNPIMHLFASHLSRHNSHKGSRASCKLSATIDGEGAGAVTATTHPIAKEPMICSTMCLVQAHSKLCSESALAQVALLLSQANHWLARGVATSDRPCGCPRSS